VWFALTNQVTDQIREYMRRTLQMDYGVNLENDWNQWVTTSWDQAQRKVGTCMQFFVSFLCIVKYNIKCNTCMRAMNSSVMRWESSKTYVHSFVHYKHFYSPS